MIGVDRHRHLGQAGFTLVETLATLLLVSFGVMALISAVLTLNLTVYSNRKTVRASIEAASIAERIENLVYKTCATPSNYAAAMISPTDAGLTLQITEIKYLQNRYSSSAIFVNTCSTDQGVQQITIKVRSADSTPGSKTLVFNKRDNRCQAPAPVGVTC